MLVNPKIGVIRDRITTTSATTTDSIGVGDGVNRSRKGENSETTAWWWLTTTAMPYPSGNRLVKR
ncbi:hypothetical protein TSUD_209620 [Trifolium subterraneum]|uniref:Uncharacterized protein n=1 Tax=Trifolium subterraneum TaxID=3900 RepID=A0A2Z6N6J5_TRISU|nr:hypothetical protein TSUD_209620 [Trifolium subterraneum]